MFEYIYYEYYKDTRSALKNFILMIKSFVKALIYLVFMPFSFLIGFHKFIDLLVRFIYHSAVFTAFWGILKIEERNI